MKATLVFLLFGCALLTTACVPATTAGAPAALPLAAVTQPTSTEPPAETSVPTETPAPTATTEPTATTLPTNTPTTEPIGGTPIPTPEQTAADQPTVSADGDEPIDTALLELGKEVYRQQACGVCHLLTSLETLGTFGPPHDDLATIAAERIGEDRYKGTATTAEEYIRESIVNPQAFFVDGYQITRFPMPIFTNLSEPEVDALVYLLMQPPASAP